MHKMKNLYQLIFFLLFCFTLYSQPVLTVTPGEYDLGVVPEGETITAKATLSNRGDRLLEVTLQSSCDCVDPETNTFKLKPGKKKTILFTIDTTGLNGPFKKELILFSNDPGAAVFFYIIKGNARGSGDTPEKEDRDSFITTTDFSQDLVKNRENILFFAYQSCRTCDDIKKKLEKWAAGQKKKPSLLFYPLEELKNKEHLALITDSMGGPPGLPLVIYDSKYYGGKNEIRLFLEGKEPSRSEGGPGKAGITAILLLGLADGINPCAFTVIILLISYLSLTYRKNKNVILYSGFIYIGAVFVTYFLVGLGLFEFLRLLAVYKIIGLFLKYGLTCILVILALFSLYDFIQALQGKAEKMTLKLPAFLQTSIRKSIRSRMKNYQVISGSLVLGFTVSLFELACTGQVYFPAIGLMVRSGGQRLKGIGLLLLYNLAFVFPLILVFLLVHQGISSDKIGKFFNRHLWTVKLLFFILFAGFALLNFFF